MNNINGIHGYGNYGVGGYVPQRKDEAAAESQAQQQPVVQNHEEQLVDSSKVMEFMEANNIYVPKTNAPAELDPEVQARVEDYMARFEEIYALIVDEFGEDLAHIVMDLVMDRLMGM